MQLRKKICLSLFVCLLCFNIPGLSFAQIRNRHVLDQGADESPPPSLPGDTTR